MRRRHYPEPRAIDPLSGFEIAHSELVRNWDGDLVARQFADKRHPQDYVRGVKEQIALPNPRPEPPEEYMAVTITTEDGIAILTADGFPLQTEGRLVAL
jgi:hypothetical protein